MNVIIRSVRMRSDSEKKDVLKVVGTTVDIYNNVILHDKNVISTYYVTKAEKSGKINDILCFYGKSIV